MFRSLEAICAQIDFIMFLALKTMSCRGEVFFGLYVLILLAVKEMIYEWLHAVEDMLNGFPL